MTGLVKIGLFCFACLFFTMLEVFNIGRRVKCIAKALDKSGFNID